MAGGADADGSGVVVAVLLDPFEPLPSNVRLQHDAPFNLSRRTLLHVLGLDSPALIP